MKPRSIVGPKVRNFLSNDRFFEEKSDTSPFRARQFILHTKIYHRRVKMKKNVFFAGIPAIMLVFGLVLVSCGDGAGGSDPTHEVKYVLTSGTLTIKGDGESSVPKDGDSFTLETSDGKKVTGTIEVAENGTITFKNNDGVEVLPSATINEGDDKIAIGTGKITFDDGTEKPLTTPETVEPVPPPAPSSYELAWAYWRDTNYSYVSSEVAEKGASLTAAGANAGYLTGDNAATAFTMISNNYPEPDNYGTETGSFEELLNFQAEGIGLPSTLKSRMNAQKANVPLGGVFQVPTYGGVAVFFVTKED
jgi:hypothetical protein